MATYKGIQGYSVQKLSDDPTASEAAGQLWYNSTSGKFKISTEGAGAWAAGGAINTGRSYLAGAGSNTAGIVFGGTVPGGRTADTETYNGTTWTETSNLVQSRDRLMSCGQVNTAVLGFGGYISGPVGKTNLTELWNGSAWTEVGDMQANKAAAGAAGTSTSGVVAGGSPNGAPTVDSESWNGSSWSEVANLNTARTNLAAAGESNTSALMIGGTPGSDPFFAGAESWNGTAWTEVADLNAARRALMASGTSTLALAWGGRTPPNTVVASNESWNGTAWTEVADLSTVMQEGTGSSITTNTSAFSTGGSPAVTATEIWDDPVYTIKTVTVS
jgi:hypothetical protein